MSSANTPWLSLYDNVGLFPRFRMDATYPKIIDAVADFEIENKKSELKTDADRKKYQEMSDKFLALAKTVRKCQKIDSKNMPQQVYLLPEEKLPDDNTIMFRISSGIFLVNQTAYDVFCEHRLGNSQFSQVYIYDIETQEKLSDTPYYFLNVGETRDFLNKEKSEGIYQHMPEFENRGIGEPKDNDIVLSENALACDVDMWHNPLLDYSLFFSNSLAQALFAKGIQAKDFGLVRCQVQ